EDVLRRPDPLQNAAKVGGEKGPRLFGALGAGALGGGGRDGRLDRPGIPPAAASLDPARRIKKNRFLLTEAVFAFNKRGLLPQRRRRSLLTEHSLPGGDGRVWRQDSCGAKKEEGQ